MSMLINLYDIPWKSICASEFANISACMQQDKYAKLYDLCC